MDPLSVRPPGEQKKINGAHPQTKKDENVLTNLAANALTQQTKEPRDLKERVVSKEEVNLLSQLYSFTCKAIERIPKINFSQVNDTISKLTTNKEWEQFSKEWKLFSAQLSHIIAFSENDPEFRKDLHQSLLRLISRILPNANSVTREEILKGFSHILTEPRAFSTPPENFRSMANFIRLYGMKDRTHLIQIVQSIAKHHPEYLFLLRDTLTDSEKVSLIQYIYYHNDWGASEARLKAIQDLAIKDPTQKIEAVAHIIFHEIPKHFYSHDCDPTQMQHFFSAYNFTKRLAALNIEDDQDSITQLFKILINRAPGIVAYNIRLLPPSLHLEIAHAIKGGDPLALCYNIGRFDINPDDQFALVKDMASFKEGADAVVRVIRNLEIKEESKRIELAQIAARSGSKDLASFIRNFNITNQEVLFKIVTSLAELGVVASNISDFDFTQPQYVEIAQKLAVSDPQVLCLSIQDLQITDQYTLLNLAKTIARQNGEILATYIDRFEIKEESERIEIAKILARTDPFAFLEHFERFEITNCDALVDLFTRIVADGETSVIRFLSYIATLLDSSTFSKMLRYAIAARPELVFLHEKAKKDESFPLAIANDPAMLDQALAALQKDQNTSPTPLINHLSLIQTPLKAFQSFEIAKDSSIASLKEHIEKMQPGKAAIETYGLEEARKHEQGIMLGWLGYVMLCCYAYRISDDLQKRHMPILQQIAAIRNPQLRIQLTEALFFQLRGGEEKVQKMMKDLSTLLKKPHAQPFIPLLAPLIAADQENFSTLLEVLNHSAYFSKNTTRRMEAIKNIAAIFHQPFLTMQDKNKILRAIFPLSGFSKADQETAKKQAQFCAQRAFKDATADNIKAAEEAQAIVERQKKEAAELPQLLDTNLQFISALIQLKGQNDTLKNLATLPSATYESAKKLSGELQTAVNAIFMNALGIKIADAENLAILFPQRNPYALMTYARYLHQLHEHTRKPVLACLRTVAQSAVDGTYIKERYNLKNSAHLQKLFKNNDTLFEGWQKGEKIPFTQFNIQEYLQEKILTDHHLDPGNYGFLVKYLQAHTAADRAEVNKTLKQSLEAADKKSTLYNRIQLQKTLIEVMNTTNGVAQRTLLMHLPKQIKEVEKEPKLHGEVKALNEIIAAARNLPIDNLTVEDTDDFHDMLLIGTDVHGSCQSVQSHPNTSKALLGYILDGKIRAIVVKDSNGRILARCIVRLLWDNTTQQPVMVQEKLYTSPGIQPHIHNAVTAMCLRRAQTLGVTLVGASPEGEATKNAYPHDLVSLGCPAPFEFMDTGGVNFTNGRYTLPATSTQVLWQPKG